jgi:membrane fusion protein, multidrug efflux system
VRLQLGTHASPVIVPTAAVRPGPQGPFVFLVDRDARRVHMQRVTPGVANGDRTAIDEGLPAGATIVLDGMDTLRDGASITVREAPQPMPQSTGQLGAAPSAAAPSVLPGAAPAGQP